MKLKVLIVEDKPKEFQEYCEVCEDIAEKIGLISDQDEFRPYFVNAQTIDEAENILLKSDVLFDIIIFDIGLENKKLPVERISSYLKNDILGESKVMILSGNEDFFKNKNLMISAYQNRVRYISQKGGDDNYSFEDNLRKLLLEIRSEYIWANIGRGAPVWKRKIFQSNKIWEEVKNGRRSRAVILIADISNSTRFINAQLDNEMSEHFPLELLKSFANDSASIIEDSSHQGFTERFSGDEILAYFLMPDQENYISQKRIDPNSEDVKICLRALDAAQEMLEKFNENFENLNTELNYILEDENGIIDKPSLRILVGYGDVRWVLQGPNSRPQLSVMTKKVAECYRIFTHRSETNRLRLLYPNSIYITPDVHKLVKDIQEFRSPIPAPIRNFNEGIIYKKVLV